MIGAVNSRGQGSGVSAITDLRILKNSDVCGGSQFSTVGAWITPTVAEAFGPGGYVLQASISSFSSFYFTSASMVVLPVQLLTFKGSLQNNSSYLQWETTNEKNSSHFDIERSIDGRNFSKVGEVAAVGNSTTNVKYAYTDEGACSLASVIYYRLRIVDQDGSSSFSKVVSVECDPSFTLALYPNPISNQLKVKLSLSKSDNIQIQVTDMQGRAVYAESRYMQAGTKEIEINTKLWPAQLYSVKVTTSNSRLLVTKNVVKQ
jgi:hypothetical protein